MSKELIPKVDPIFELGKVPKASHLEIQDREWVDGNWKYFIRNNYNPWGSGWSNEDSIIKEINNQA